jgi:hypothetical protein
VKTPSVQRAAGRKRLAAKGHALAGGTAPVPDVAYLRKAIRAKGRVDPAKWPALKRLIVKRARQLKATGAPGVKGTWPFQGANDGGTVIGLAREFRYRHGWIPVGGEAERTAALRDHLVTQHATRSSMALSPHLKEADLDWLHRAGHGEHSPAGIVAPGKLAAGHRLDAAGHIVHTPAGQAHANDSEAIDLAAMTRRMPVVRGAADVQMSRTAPGVITVMHKSSGMKVGTITPKGKGYAGTHADGTGCGASGSQQGALAGLIAHHNKRARGVPAAPAAKAYAGDEDAVDLAGALPFTSAATSADGPRVTSASAGKPAATAKPGGGLSPYAAAIYRKFIAKGMKPAVAMAFAKRADAMHAKAGS